MPIFDFHCTACQAGFERLTKLSDPLPPCPTCGSTAVQRVLSRLFPENTASRALCRRFGFREVGVYERHGQLDGDTIAWLGDPCRQRIWRGKPLEG